MHYLQTTAVAAFVALVVTLGVSSLSQPQATAVVAPESSFGANTELTTVKNRWSFLDSVTFASTTFNGLQTDSPNAISTTTTGGNAATLSQANLLAGQYWTVNVNQAADFTYTLPATSTLTTLLANTGESATFTFHNATTAAGIDVVFAAGTGIDLEGSTTSLKLLPTTSGTITFTRKANTDVTAIFRPNADLD